MRRGDTNKTDTSYYKGAYTLVKIHETTEHTTRTSTQESRQDNVHSQRSEVEESHRDPRGVENVREVV